ncbi:g5364 [Coccomyxa elongata]
MHGTFKTRLCQIKWQGRQTSIGTAFPLKCEQVLDSDQQDAVLEETATSGPVWSSILTFLRLSKPRRTNLPLPMTSHEVVLIIIEAEDVLKPNLATHLACGHLSGIAKENTNLMFILNRECYEVLSQVQLNNLLALAHAKSVAALGLCREIATTCATSAAATAVAPAAGMPLAERRHAARTGQATEIGSQTEKLAQVMAAGLSPSRGRKRQIADSSWKSEGRPASQRRALLRCLMRRCPSPSLPRPFPLRALPGL